MPSEAFLVPSCFLGTRAREQMRDFLFSGRLEAIFEEFDKDDSNKLSGLAN